VSNPRVALVLPGFSADESDWCIPALLNYVRALAERVDVEVFALRYPHRGDRYRIGAATVQSLGWAQRRGLYSLTLWLAAYRAILRRHRASPFSVVHAFWAEEPAWIAVACAKRMRVPLVVSLAGGELSDVPQAKYGLRRHRLQSRMIAQALRSAHVVTAGSRTLIAQAASQGIGHVQFAPLGVDTRLFAPRAAMPRTAQLLSVGSLLSVKGHEVLLRAMRRVVAAQPAAHLTIIGDGPERSRLQRLIGTLHLQAHVSLDAAIAHEQLSARYAAADLYVQSSWHEAQGMAVLEAAACGVPLAGTHVGALADLAPDAALAVPAGDETALADASLALLSDEQRRVSLAEAALTQVTERYCVAGCVDRFRRFYAVKE
jgi:glycosyltransferase involved in cell wall biosynthesis